jgi:hypothetical protein
MSWSYSLVQVEEYSAACCSDTELSALLSTTPTPDQFYWPDKTTEHSRLSRFGMTCVPLTASHGEALLTWYLAGFHARTSALQEVGPDWTAKGQGYGEKWLGLLGRFDPDSCSLKTAQLSLLEDLTACCPTLPRWGLMLDGELYPQPIPALCTDEKESGFLPTPSGCSNHGSNHVAGRLDEWGGSSNPWRGTEIGKISCPAFEEWVMGWPVQFTALTPLGTAKFQEFVQQHGICSMESEAA